MGPSVQRHTPRLRKHWRSASTELGITRTHGKLCFSTTTPPPPSHKCLRTGEDITKLGWTATAAPPTVQSGSGAFRFSAFLGHLKMLPWGQGLKMMRGWWMRWRHGCVKRRHTGTCPTLAYGRTSWRRLRRKVVHVKETSVSYTVSVSTFFFNKYILRKEKKGCGCITFWTTLMLQHSGSRLDNHIYIKTFLNLKYVDELLYSAANAILNHQLWQPMFALSCAAAHTEKPCRTNKLLILLFGLLTLLSTYSIAAPTTKCDSSAWVLFSWFFFF